MTFTALIVFFAKNQILQRMNKQVLHYLFTQTTWTEFSKKVQEFPNENFICIKNILVNY